MLTTVQYTPGECCAISGGRDTLVVSLSLTSVAGSFSAQSIDYIK